MRVLIVEDDAATRLLLKDIVDSRGGTVLACADAETGWDAWRETAPPLVLLDWVLPGMDGLDLCKKIRAAPGGDRSVIVALTSNRRREDIETLLDAGVDDYITKPINTELLEVRLTIAEHRVRERIRRAKAEEAVQDLRRQLDGLARFEDLVGKSKPMRLVYDLIHEVARLDTMVLIEGETGTGKELVARAIHAVSHRKHFPFIAVNCAGLTESLLASQLFGHRRGAFTGAVEDHRGYFEVAQDGTLLLDEIGDVPLPIQRNLLRVLQEREIVRLGESRPHKVNVRVLTATNRNLDEEVAAGNFRRDLLYRIRVARIHLPPLRERREDIPLLVGAFLNEIRAAHGRAPGDLSHDALRLLLEYPWPGNVRELRSAMEFAAIRCKDPLIGAEDLPPEIVDRRHWSLQPPASLIDERQRVSAALAAARGRRTVAAQLLGISRATLYRRLAEFGIVRDG